MSASGPTEIVDGHPEILLTTLNATWEHASFGLRCLFAALGELQPRAKIQEHTIKDRTTDIVEQILAQAPRIVGMGVYIWNARETLEVVQQLKVLAPDVVIVLGGPEVSFETDNQALTHLADYVVRGEGEIAFYQLCQTLLSHQTTGRANSPVASSTKNLLPIRDTTQPSGPSSHLMLPKVHVGGRPDLNTLFAQSSPYEWYSDEDLTHRVVYLEASRGCPFSCEFCLSSLDEKVRTFPLDDFLHQMESLMVRGLQRFKFVDRTFNLKIQDATRILDFFLERFRPGMFLHFEMIPDRLPEALRERLAKFPLGAVQLEVGIQTFSEDVSARISRKQSIHKLEENIRWLRAHTGVHIHADLIAGLPGEDFETFGRGFDQLYALDPHEIQLGVLKRLRGAPIDRHTMEFDMRYSQTPPYEVLQTSALSFAELQRLKRLARFFDMVHNSGRFPDTVQLLVSGQPFRSWLSFSDWLWAKTRATAGISLARLTELLLEYLVDEQGIADQETRQALENDRGRDRIAGLPKRQGLHARGRTQRADEAAQPQRAS